MFKKKQTFKDLPSSDRPIDQIADDVSTWWQRSYVFVKKTKVKTWQGALILAFATGVAVAVIWTAQLGIHIFSSAVDPSANLSFVTSTITAEAGEDVPIDVVVDTMGNNVVAARVVILYNNENFQYVSYDTSASVFSAENACVFNEKPCEIFENDSINGKVALTLAKPTPGINTSSGYIGTFVFKALREVDSSIDDIKIQFIAPGSYDDSDVIADDGSGTDILQSVTPMTITVEAPACSSFDYSAFGECQVGDIQYRTVINRTPEGCDPGVVELSQSCTFIPETCTSFTYSEWGICQPNGKQTRTIVSSSPLGCIDGTPEELEQSCVYTEIVEAATCTEFTYSDWGSCQQNNLQVRTVATSSPADCTGGLPDLEQECSYSSQVCSEFTYSDWGACVDRQQSRSVTTLGPVGCSGGNPVLTQSCETPAQKKVSTKKKDKEKPKFTDLPLTLTKKRGDTVWWKAKDNKGISHYKYTFNGKTVKTKQGKMTIPADAPRGVSVLNVKAYDKAGNSKSRKVMLLVR